MSARAVNKVILIGNVGVDPDIRYFPNGDAVANVSLATSETWKDKNTGEPQERTEWHRVVCRGKLAEIVKQYVHKGSKLYVEGSLRTRKWQTQDGQDRYTTEVVVAGPNSEMIFLDSRPGGGSSAPYDNPAQRSAAPAGGGAQSGSPAGNPGGYDESLMGGGSAQDFGDDIPF